jgi:site-specific DNA-cytosine methylase
MEPPKSKLKQSKLASFQSQPGQPVNPAKPDEDDALLSENNTTAARSSARQLTTEERSKIAENRKKAMERKEQRKSQRDTDHTHGAVLSSTDTTAADSHAAACAAPEATSGTTHSDGTTDKAIPPETLAAPSPVHAKLAPHTPPSEEAHVLGHQHAEGDMCDDDSLLHTGQHANPAVKIPDEDPPSAAPPPQSAPAAPAMESQKSYEQLKDLYRYPKRLVGAVKKASLHPMDIIKSLAASLAVLTYSTSFSGIDMPGTSMKLMACQLSAELGQYISSPGHLWAVEHDDHCRRELMKHPCKPHCLFGDILAFASLVLLQLAKQCTLSLENCVPLLEKAAKLIELSASCALHGMKCKLVRASMHIAGTPCVEWSSMGPRTNGNGDTCMIFLVWILMRRVLQETLIIQENSKNFAVDVLVKLLGDMYIIDTTTICPSSLGWPGRRERRWTILILRSAALVATSSLSNVMPLFHDTCFGKWTIFLVQEICQALRDKLQSEFDELKAKRISSSSDDTLNGVYALPPDERRSELKWARSRPSSRHRQCHVTSTDNGPCWEASLSEREIEYLDIYHSRPGSHLKCHFLHQNPTPGVDRGQSSTDTILQVVLRSCESALLSYLFSYTCTVLLCDLLYII